VKRSLADEAASRGLILPRKGLLIKTVNLKFDLPPVQEALSRLDRELALARQQSNPLLKIVHGYGSSGVGGDIRIAVQKRLSELQKTGEIVACIFGENWAKSNEQTWRLLQACPDLKKDPDLGRRNAGITIVVLK
jgi:hypothetical protein